MATVTVDIKGIAEACGSLEAAQAKIAAGIAAGVARAGAIVEADAKGQCPVATGNLRASINMSAGGNTCTVGTNCEYAGYVEFGTYKMAAQPYLIPALLNNVGTIVSCIKSAVEL